MALTLWYFRLAPDGQFRRMSAPEHDQFYWGKAPAEPTEPGVVLTANAFVELDRRVPTKVLDIRFDRYAVDESGCQTKQMVDLRSTTWHQVVSANAFNPSPGYVPSIESQRAKHRARQEFTWRPTDEQIESLKSAINARAGLTLLPSRSQSLTLIP